MGVSVLRRRAAGRSKSGTGACLGVAATVRADAVAEAAGSGSGCAAEAAGAAGAIPATCSRGTCCSSSASSGMGLSRESPEASPGARLSGSQASGGGGGSAVQSTKPFCLPLSMSVLSSDAIFAMRSAPCHSSSVACHTCSWQHLRNFLRIHIQRETGVEVMQRPGPCQPCLPPLLRQT